MRLPLAGLGVLALLAPAWAKERTEPAVSTTDASAKYSPYSSPSIQKSADAYAAKFEAMDKRLSAQVGRIMGSICSGCAPTEKKAVRAARSAR